MFYVFKHVIYRPTEIYLQQSLFSKRIQVCKFRKYSTCKVNNPGNENMLNQQMSSKWIFLYIKLLPLGPNKCTSHYYFSLFTLHNFI